MFCISCDEIKADLLIRSVEHPEAGAIVSFQGTVRNHSEGKPVNRILYEANVEMAGAMIENIAQDILKRMPVKKIAIQHRTGMLQVGETSVFIAVSSAHRSDAFEACRTILDTIKSTVPIWKKEFFKDGSNWVEGNPVT